MKNFLIFALLVLGVSGHLHFEENSIGRIFDVSRIPRTCPFVCPFGKICVKGMCVVSESHSQSISSYRPERCFTRKDCRDPTDLCINGRCATYICSENRYCPKGHICINEKCDEPKCVAECPTGQKCVEGVCQSIPVFNFY